MAAVTRAVLAAPAARLSSRRVAPQVRAATSRRHARARVRDHVIFSPLRAPDPGSARRALADPRARRSLAIPRSRALVRDRLRAPRVAFRSIPPDDATASARARHHPPSARD